MLDASTCEFEFECGRGGESSPCVLGANRAQQRILLTGNSTAAAELQQSVQQFSARSGTAMQVQVNHDNHVRIGEETAQRLTQVLESSLSQYVDRITRIEMHLGDENSAKGGAADKRCMLEARLRNLEPIAVTHQAESLQLAFEGALEKLERALSRQVGKLQTH